MNKEIYSIIKEIFYVLLVALLAFIIMELIKPNIVQAYISLNLLLILWLVSGMVLIVLNSKLHD